MTVEATLSAGENVIPLHGLVGYRVLLTELNKDDDEQTES